IYENSRYATKGKNGMRKPKKVLRYFPIIPRLRQLYMREQTAKHMRWYKKRDTLPGVISHPADGDEWNNFDSRYLLFASEIRNVRIGPATDGFCPFSNSCAKAYSVWPVIMVVYNLPPSMCMKQVYMYMTLLIPGEKRQTKDLSMCI